MWASPRLIRGAINHHLFTVVSSLGRLSQQPLNSLLTVGVIAIALALPAGLYAGLKNLEGISHGWESLGDVALYLELGTEETRALALATTLQERSEIEAITVISPEQASSDLAQVAGFGDALAALPTNPLPWVLVLRPQPELRDPDRLAGLVAQLESLESVDLVQFDRQWVHRLNGLLRIGNRAVQVIAALLALAVVLVVGNTIRLDIENRRAEIEVTQLLGATNGFIRRPFLYGGIWYGLLGGLVATGLVGVGALVLDGPVVALADAYNSDFRLTALSGLEGVQLVLSGAAIGWLGSWIAVSRQLARNHPDNG